MIPNPFRRKRPVPESPVESASAPAVAAEALEEASPAPAYEPWSPGGAELAPQLVEVAPEVAETLPPPPGVSEGHPLASQLARALSSVYDPEIPVDIYQLGLIYEVALNERNDAHIFMTLTTPGCPVAGSMPGMVEHAVATMVEGVGDVEVELVWDPPWNPDMMSEAARLELGFM